jgi:hypothetical protein
MAPTVSRPSKHRKGLDRREIPPMAVKISVAERLAKLEEKYLHELLPEEERLELRERILRLRRKLAAAARA